jgi:hypothetical protein
LPEFALVSMKLLFEIGILSRQCLGSRRIPDLKSLLLRALEHDMKRTGVNQFLKIKPRAFSASAFRAVSSENIS